MLFQGKVKVINIKGQGHIKVEVKSIQGQGHFKVKGQGHDCLMPQSHPSHHVHDLVIKNLNPSLTAQNVDSNLDLQTIALNCGPQY